MQGIQSLMPGQAQQAPMPMPQQSSSTPSAMTGSLKNMPMEQLKMLFQNPQPNSPPLWAVISALAEKQKEAQAIQAAMGQGAMAQNAMMQQQPPVAAQVVQAAEGGIMQGYAGGGAVAFKRGGDVQHFSGGSKEFGVVSDPEAYALDALRSEQEQNKQKVRDLENSYFYLLSQNDPRAAQVKQQLDALSGRASVTARPAPAPAPVMLPEAQALMSRQGPRGIMAVAPRTSAVGAPPVSQPKQTQQRPQTEVAAPVAPSDLTPEMLKAYADREAQMRGRLVRPESLTKAEEGLAALAKANIEAQRAEAEAYGKDIRAARDAAMARSQRSLLDDPQALLALAGSIDARRGQAIGSLARGAAGVMGQRQAAEEAARKEFTQAQRDERTMQANIRQTQMLEAQRQVALEQGKLNEVNAINEKLSELGMEREKFRLTRGDTAFEQAIKGRQVAATERQARAAEVSAGKQNEMEFARSNPEEYARILKARAEATQARVSPEDRRAATMERYADNWEKLDMMQKNELAKQGVTNFQQYVRMRDQMTAGNIPQAPSQGAPAVGTVMQGYRFKGGNPADKNNWEKV
jgi:hypothetical protein